MTLHRRIIPSDNSDGLFINFPNKKYDIIYVDPPWEETGGGKIKRGADKHYKVLKTQDILKLPVNSISKLDCHLYLWVTNSFVPDGLRCIEEWGFRYLTAITWVKNSIGLGQYFRGKTEHCLFAVRGMIPYKIVNGKRQQEPTCFYAKKRKHSEKPEEMRKIIEKVSDRKGFDKIELFARNSHESWHSWGNEITT